jgi:hypothetical protein
MEGPANRAHKRRESDASEPAVVGDLDLVQVVERAEEVGERFDAPAADTIARNRR